MALCGFNLYRDQKRQRQQRRIAQLKKEQAVAAVVKEKLSSKKAQQDDGSEKELSTKPVGLSIDGEKKPIQKRKLKKRIKKEV